MKYGLRKLFLTFAGLAVGFFGMGISAHADVIISHLFNTGVGNSGHALANGAVDPHYKASAPSASPIIPLNSQSFVVTSASGYPVAPIGPWLGDSTTSAWTSPDGAQQGLDPSFDGFYDYKTHFFVTGTLPPSFEITGQWATDNYGTEIDLNGHMVVQASLPGSMDPGVYVGFDSWTPFDIVTSGLTLGWNTLDFKVTNIKQGSGNPTALRVEFNYSAPSITPDLTPSIGHPVPEPSSFALLGLGGFGMAIRAIRRRGQAAAI